MSKPRILWSVIKQMKAGKIITFRRKNFQKKNILYFQSDSLEILNPEMAPLQIDGDHLPLPIKNFIIEILPSAFNLIQP